MTFGFEGKNGVRTSKEQDCQEILDVFFGHSHKELDTARVYAEGTTEEVIAPSDPCVFVDNTNIASSYSRN